MLVSLGVLALVVWPAAAAIDCAVASFTGCIRGFRVTHISTTDWMVAMLRRVIIVGVVLFAAGGCGGRQTGRPSASDLGTGAYEIGLFTNRGAIRCVGEVLRDSRLKDRTLKGMFLSDSAFSLPAGEQQAMEQAVAKMHSQCNIEE